MEIEDLEIQGVKLLKNKLFEDGRGSFFKPFSNDDFLRENLKMEIKEVFYSASRRNVIRGMHFQLPPFELSKLVNVIKGTITDVMLDLRINSKTYRKYLAIEMKESDGISIFIPKGIAHGFLSKSDETILLYMVDNSYSPMHDTGIRFDSFGYEWKVRTPILSDRDLSFKQIKDFDSPFRI